MPLPNALLHLQALVRPSLLRSHLRVPSLTSLSYPLLRQDFNAIVIDKDNCLTHPEDDAVWHEYEGAWAEMKRVFGEGRVLVVSNSAGCWGKDDGGIGAESLSLSLRAPVLIHPQPKPGCAPSIVAYFAGRLGPPRTLRSQIIQQERQLEQREKEDEKDLWDRLDADVETRPLLGPLVDGMGRVVKLEHTQGAREGSTEQRMKAHVVNRASNSTVSPHPTSSPPSHPSSSLASTSASTATHEAPKEQLQPGKEDELRIIVIGDRAFTDILLAHRLSLILPRSTSADLPRALAIQTTSLPKSNDVRFLRWVENKVSGGRVKRTSVDYWDKYVRPDPLADPALDILRGEHDGHLTTGGSRRWTLGSLVPFRRRFEDAPRLSWRPATWRPLPVLVALGRLTWLGVRGSVRGAGKGAGYVYSRARRRWDEGRIASTAADPVEGVKRVEQVKGVHAEKQDSLA